MSAGPDEWLAYAEDDLKFAAVGLREGFYSQVCYHSQQAIEKMLKAYLVAQKKSYPKTHGLIELTRLAPDLPLNGWLAHLGRIEDYYVPVRYPDAAPGMKSSGPPNKEEAEEALKTAEEVFKVVADALGKITTP